MSSFQRMIAIPQEEYLALSSMQSVKQPLAKHYYDLESRYKDEENIRDPYRRMMLQSDTLEQMKQVKEQMRNSLAISTPKPYKSRANALFQTLESVLKFNDKGEIYSNDGTVISGTRMEDLIQHAVRDRRRNMTPKGWSDFLTILRDHNVPKSILNRNTLDEMEGKVTIKSEPSFIKQISPQADKKGRVPRRDQPKRSTKTTAKDVLFLKKFKNG